MAAGMPDYQSLERTASMIARHPFYPEKPALVRECLDDVERRFRGGELSETERARLVAILAAG